MASPSPLKVKLCSGDYIHPGTWLTTTWGVNFFVPHQVKLYKATNVFNLQVGTLFSVMNGPFSWMNQHLTALQELLAKTLLLYVSSALVFSAVYQDYLFSYSLGQPFSGWCHVTFLNSWHHSELCRVETCPLLTCIGRWQEFKMIFWPRKPSRSSLQCDWSQAE